ncbi:MAG: hypothetical protein ACYS9X_03755 [Planctomycetota bacterium]|jgi:hypothetical protein
MAGTAKRSALAALGVCAAVAGARAADTFRFDVREDASVALVDASGRGFCELRLEIEAADGTPARVLRARGSRKARALVGGTALHLTAYVRDAGGGVIVDLRAAPAVARGERDAWTEPKALRARVVARLDAGAIGRGSATICGTEVLLGPDEVFGPDALARARGARREPASASARGRTVRIVPEKADPFVLQGELPSEIDLEERVEGDEDNILLRLAAADADTACRLAFAVYVGRRPYTGRPVFLGKPRVEYRPALRCFEATLRAFGEWRDPFDPEDVAVEASWRASPRAGRVAGFYSRGFETKTTETDDGEPEETLTALGWPSFRARLPEAASGGAVTVAFATKGGRSAAKAPVPSNRIPPRAADTGKLSAAAGVTLDTSDWQTVKDAGKAFRALYAARLGTARLPIHEGDWALERERAGAADLGAAWRLDRAFEEAAKRGVVLVPVLGRCRAPEEFAGSSPYFSGDEPLAKSAREFFEAPSSRAAFRRTLRYAAARWGALASLGGWEIFDGADLLVDGAAADGLAPWVGSMADWLKAHDPDHPASVTLRAGTPAGPLKLAGVAVGRAFSLASDGESAEQAFDLARESASGADFLVFETEDPEATAAHAALWAAATAGSGGGVFLGAGALADEAAAVVRYLGEGGPVGELPSPLSFEEQGYRLLGRRGPSGAAWWIARAGDGGRGSPEDVDDDEPGAVRFLPVIRDVEFEIDDLVPGRYAVEWWQTHEGRLLTRTEVRAPEGRVLLRAPPFASDIAGRLVRLDDKIPSFLGR